MNYQRIAIIGSGISGLGAAYLLHDRYDVTLFESNDRLGGHTNTVSTPTGCAIDTGFIVFNEKNYPNFCRLLEVLGVESILSDMSFGYYDPSHDYYYSSDFPSGIFSKKKNLVSPSYYQFLSEIFRFNRIGQEALLNGISSVTIREFLTHHKFSSKFIHEYVIPMGSAIWSTPHSDTLQFPAKSFLSFWDNHCLLQVFNRPKWRTVKNGSRSYIDAILKKTKLNVYLNHPIQSINRHKNGVILHGPNGPIEFDAVIIATHADQALQLLDQPTDLESDLLGQWQYSKNPTILHTDPSVMPPKRSAWASWLYSRSNDHTMTASYYMNRLQSLNTPDDYIVTLNASRPIHNTSIIYQTTYEHPLMTNNSMGTQSSLHELQGIQHTFYCGSYFGYGFHEDGLKSAIDIGKIFRCQL